MTDKNIEYEWLDRMGKLNKYNEWLFSHIKDYLGNSVWEAGAGIGTYSKCMSGVKFLFLSDVVDGYLKKLNMEFNNFNNVIVERIDLTNEDYRKLQHYNIDTVVCINVLEHVEHDLKAMENIYKVLKNDGRFLFIGPNHPFLYGSLDKYANHFRRYTKKGLTSSLNKIGFKIEKISVVNSLAAFNWFLQSKILKRKIISEEGLEMCEKFIALAKIVDRINPFPIGSNIVVIARK